MKLDITTGIAVKIFKVMWRKVKVVCVQVCECYNGGGIHFDDVKSRLTCFKTHGVSE